MPEFRLSLPGRYKDLSGESNPARRHGEDVRVICGATPDLARAEYRRLYKRKLKLKVDEKIDVQTRSDTGNLDDGPLAVSKPVPTQMTTYDDSQFVRTAIVVESGEGGSLDLVDASGRRLAQLNVQYTECGGESHFIADVIDVDGQFAERRVFTFSAKKARTVANVTGTLVSVDFRSPPKKSTQCTNCGRKLDSEGECRGGCSQRNES